MKPKGRHYPYVIQDDPWVGLVDDPKHVQKVQRRFNSFWSKTLDRTEEPMKHTKVWEVWAFCGENPDNITTIPSGNPFTFADDEAEAILKSRICEMIAGYKGLDFKYVTIIANEIGTIKVNK